MEDMKNVIPQNMFDLLERAGICTRKQILTLSIWDLKKATNMQEEDIYLIKNIIASQTCPPVILSEKICNERHVKTGCCSIDRFLNGGFRKGTLTEVYGESGTGKTQLAMQVAAQCGREGSVYICTEGAFPIKRFNQIYEHLHSPSFDDKKEHVFLEHITESQDLLSCIRVRLPKLLRNEKISVIIIDSIAAPFRVDINDYVKRAEELRELGVLLMELAQNNNLAVICINQVTSPLDTSDHVLPSLGLVWSNIITYRILLRRTTITGNSVAGNKINVRELEIIFAPDLSSKKCKLVIDSGGLKSL